MLIYSGTLRLMQEQGNSGDHVATTSEMPSNERMWMRSTLTLRKVEASGQSTRAPSVCVADVFGEIERDSDDEDYGDEA